MLIPTVGLLNAQGWELRILGFASYENNETLYFEDFYWRGDFTTFNISYGNVSHGHDVYLDSIILGARAMCQFYADLTNRPDVFLSEDRIQLSLIGDASITTLLPAVAPVEPEVFTIENKGVR